MNNFVIAVGTYVAELTELAIAAGKKIGKVPWIWATLNARCHRRLIISRRPETRRHRKKRKQGC